MRIRSKPSRVSVIVARSGNGKHGTARQDAARPCKEPPHRYEFRSSTAHRSREPDQRPVVREDPDPRRPLWRLTRSTVPAPGLLSVGRAKADRDACEIPARVRPSIRARPGSRHRGAVRRRRQSLARGDSRAIPTSTVRGAGDSTEAQEGRLARGVNRGLRRLTRSLSLDSTYRMLLADDARRTGSPSTTLARSSEREPCGIPSSVGYLTSSAMTRAPR